MQSTGVLLSMLKRRMQSASPSQHCPTAETAGETTDEAADEAAGSITGAPKPRTMQIIAEAEGYERGFYTGVMGCYAGGRLDSAVMIRFIEQENGQLYFKAGGGITAQSRWESEYNEVKQKIYVPIY